jgi:hypothetical protein
MGLVYQPPQFSGSTSRVWPSGFPSRRDEDLVAGKNLIDAIQEKIDRLRPVVIEEGSSVKPSDAEVVDFALADCLAGIQETEVHEMSQSRHGRA